MGDCCEQPTGEWIGWTYAGDREGGPRPELKSEKKGNDRLDDPHVNARLSSLPLEAGPDVVKPAVVAIR